MEEKSREQEMSAREISLIRELAQIRKEYKRELEYEKFDGYELPPRTQFSMLNKPAVSIKYGVMKFNMACIRLFEGIKYVLPILHPNKKRLALIMCPEEDSASVEWARQKDENWVNKDISQGVKAEGISIGEMRMLVKQVRKGRVTIEEAAEDAGMTVEEFKKILENTPLQAV